MASEIRNMTQKVRVTDVGNIVVTDIIASDTEGQRLREIRIYGVTAPDVPVLTVQLEGATDTVIKVTTPAIDF
jgi:hypothetical protein